MENERTTNDAAEKLAFDLAASALQGAGFKQALIFATRLENADDTKKINKSDQEEVEKYGLGVVQAMDTITMLASVGSHIERLIREHPEERDKVAHFVVKLGEAIMNCDTEA